MKAYFYIFLVVSMALFAVVMRQIRFAIAETERENQAWLAIQILKH